MRQLEKDFSGESFSFIGDTSNSRMVEVMDVRTRASLVQDVIDRLIDRKFGKAYLQELKDLNEQYRIEYRIVNGVRILESSTSRADTQKVNEINSGSNAEGLKSKPETTLFEEGDIQSRADLVQEVIDRIISKVFGKEYLADLERLHCIYPIGFKIIDGMRNYESDSVPSSKVNVSTAEVKAEEEVQDSSLVELTNLVKDAKVSVPSDDVSGLIRHVKNVAGKRKDLFREISKTSILDTLGGHLKDYIGPRRSRYMVSIYKPDFLQKLSIFTQSESNLASVPRDPEDKIPIAGA